MAGIPKWKKEQEKRLLPNPIFTEEQEKWIKYCRDKEIRISPVATLDNEIGKWNIGISTPDDFRKVYRSPEKCDKYSVWEIYLKYNKYYYDKQI